MSGAAADWVTDAAKNPFLPRGFLATAADRWGRLQRGHAHAAPSEDATRGRSEDCGLRAQKAQEPFCKTAAGAGRWVRRAAGLGGKKGRGLSARLTSAVAAR